MTARMQYQPITIAGTELTPRVTKAQLEPLISKAPELLNKAPVALLIDRTPYTVTTSTLAEWLTATSTDSGYKLTLSPEAIVSTLTKPAASLLREAKNGFLELNSNNTIKTFTPPTEGVAIDGAATAKLILDSFNSTTTRKAVPVSLARSTPRIDGADAVRLGIHDLLGVGSSYFDGSPANRRKNIAMGKDKMNGILIAPGEEFSQLQALGDINGANGWLPELVIKGDKTVPEYGGGLCQVGSTSFRAAMAAGLKITERRNHSYRVRYYEPIGTDATIYEPSPDFRFKNDTSAHILITAEMKGDALHFSIWGTDDGRKAEQKLSGAYNIVPAPATKYIETTDLAPGQKRCTESAHAGASAHVDYTVTYGDGTIQH
jgi:vancomycin resistance protein YoaR